MQGKNTFTLSETENIKYLLRQKSRASRSEQKGIRAKLRNLQFYITDFDISQSGFTAEDFENLIRTNRITITNNNQSVTLSDDKPINELYQNKNDFDKLRDKYKPKKIKVLYIGESPPSSGTFFYAANSNLFRCINNSFTNVFGESVGTGFDFLEYFKNHDFFLDDLCLESVNDKSDSERLALRRKGIEPLANRIKTISPEAIIIVMKGIELEVRQAVRKSGKNINYIFVTTFPSFSHTNKDNCISDIGNVLNELIELGIINIIDT